MGSMIRLTVRQIQSPEFSKRRRKFLPLLGGEGRGEVWREPFEIQIPQGQRVASRKVGQTIGGSARAARAVSSALAGNIGEGVRRGRRTRQPGAAVLPIPNVAASRQSAANCAGMQMATFCRKPLRQ